MFKKNLATAGRAAPAAQGPAALLLIVAGLRLSKNRPKHPCRLSLPSRLGLQKYNLYPYVAHPTRTFFREICEKYRNKLTYSMIKLHNFHENTDRKTETKEKTKEKHQNMKTPIIIYKGFLSFLPNLSFKNTFAMPTFGRQENSQTIN